LTILVKFHDLISNEIHEFDFQKETNRIGLYLFVSSRIENNLSINSFTVTLDNKELNDNLISLSPSSII
jgi:hypothetical protein